MPESFYYIRTAFFTGLCVCFLAAFSFGQNAKLQNDLNDSFKKFDLIKLNKQTARRQVDTSKSLSISTAEKKFELNLTPNDLRAAGYLAQDSGENGVKTLENGEVTTFKGKVAGEADSEVRMTVSGAAIEGYVVAGGEKFFIEPAQNYSRFAAAEDVVVYRAEDLLRNKNFTCDSDLGGRIEHGKEIVAENGVRSAQEQRVLELATEADYQYVTRVGSVAQANNEILSTLNMVEGMYERELNISISVTFQHTWSTADPFADSDAGSLLVSLKDYWNTNFPQSQYQRNTTYLFSGKASITGVGIAYTSVICRSPNFAYGLGGRTTSALANNLVTAHEIGHNLGATHVDATQSCANTTMNAIVSELTPPIFCPYSRNEVSTFVTTSASCLKTKTVAPAANRAKFDFDGDGKADIGVWRQTNGVWYITNSSNASFSFVQFGSLSDRLVPADYDGDGKTDIAVYRAGTWYRLKSSTNSLDVVSFGNSTDIPVAADFDGDGKADIAVFRPSDGVWHRLLSGGNNAYSAVQFGANGDVPLPADYDGDGKADVNVWRPSNGVWYRLNSSNNSFYAAQFGSAEDKPVMGDFDGDGKADLVVWRPSNGVWYQLSSRDGAFTGAAFGTLGDIPMAADYDGDGRMDVAVFRPASGNSYRLNSSNGAFNAVQFGAAGDTPISASYNR